MFLEPGRVLSEWPENEWSANNSTTKKCTKHQNCGFLENCEEALSCVVSCLRCLLSWVCPGFVLVIEKIRIGVALGKFSSTPSRSAEIVPEQPLSTQTAFKYTPGPQSRRRRRWIPAAITLYVFGGPCILVLSICCIQPLACTLLGARFELLRVAVAETSRLACTFSA